MNTMLFPNIHGRNNRIKHGETKVIGIKGELEVIPPFGRDVVTVVASAKQFSDINAALRKAGDGYYREFSRNTRGALEIRKRGIGVVKPMNRPHNKNFSQQYVPDTVATDTCFIFSRAIVD
jgi:hypothetical protein